MLTTWATVGGTLVLAPIGLGQLLAPGRRRTSRRIGGAVPQIVLAVLYSGMLAAALANVVVFHGVRLLGPTRVTTIQALVPALAVVLAFIFLGEPIRLGQVVGGAIILAGVAAHAAGIAAGTARRTRRERARRDAGAGRRAARPAAASRASRRWPSSSTTTGRSP